MHFLLIVTLIVIGIVLLARTGSDGAAGRLGQVIYWAATGVGVLVVIGGVWSLTNPTNDDIGVLFIFLGGLIWMAGWAFRYVLTGTRSLR
jgi:hypothetical protein